MPHTPRFILLLCIPLLLPAVVRAQSIRGVVVEQGGESPVMGAFVRLLDAGGVQRAAALTDSAGRFLVRAPAPGGYRLRAERIGHETTTTPELVLAAGAMVSYRLEVPTQSIRLDPISVEGSGRCCIARDAGAETHALWEEVRKALRVVTWRLADDAVAYQFAAHESTRDLGSLGIVEQQRRLVSGLGAPPFRSASAVDLAQNGYVRKAADGEYEYYALDAHTLLSDAFLETHCFRVRRPGRAQRGLVGLAFEPLPQVRLPDIEGALWLDAGTWELRYLEFQFTRHLLPVGGNAGAFGGQVHFTRLSNGAWVVREWWLRMPIYQVSLRRDRTVPDLRDLQRVAQEGTLQVRETGARITFADDARVDHEPGHGVIEGVLFDSTRLAPLAGATVFVLGSGHAAQTDVNGRFRLAQLQPGARQLAFFHPRTDSLLLALEPRRVDVPETAATAVRLAVPAAAGCPLESERHATLVGFVLDAANGSPVAGADVAVSWRGSPERRTRSDARGRYVLCGVPTGTMVRLGARAGARRPRIDLEIAGAGIHQQDLVVR